MSVRQAAIAILIAAVTACPARASASTIEFEFEASLETGALAGTQFFGTASYDDSGITGVGEEFLPLTSLDFSFLGETFTLADIGQGGQVILEDGTFSYFTAAFFPSAPSPIDDIAFGFGGPGVIGYSTPPGFNFGLGAYEIVTPVPEPQPFVLCAVAFCASLFRFGRRLYTSRAGGSGGCS
jgi:hypothetical protein